MLAVSLGLPVTEPVMIFALAMLVFVSVPLFFERFRIPGIIGLIVAGAVVGPNGLGLLERNETIVLLGTVGLLYLMFMAGVEIDLHGFRKYRNRSPAFGGITFLLLSPAAARQEHLHHLSALTRLVRDSERLRELLQGQDVESVLEGVRTDGTRAERV